MQTAYKFLFFFVKIQGEFEKGTLCNHTKNRVSNKYFCYKNEKKKVHELILLHL